MSLGTAKREIAAAFRLASHDAQDAKVARDEAQDRLTAANVLMNRYGVALFVLTDRRVPESCGYGTDDARVAEQIAGHILGRSPDDLGT